MGYPEDALAPDEELVLHRHPHWKMLLVPGLVFVVASAVCGFALGLVQRNLTGAAATTVTVVVLVVWGALVFWRSVVPLLRWLTTHFIVTDRRVLVREGLVTHTGIDIPVARVSNVQFRHGLIDRMLRTGTLVIVAASDDPLEFDDIPDVERVHSLLYRQVMDAGDARW
ncbi:PH domain-containing protein [Rhodococcus sp. HNM0569]|uniref:PH domain-containing protein n=1 Tax=Rhodococcus sp. HNM0569 TaxID=2716340 RepID=UPI00146D03C9|nr:PH domain-containing protein [Rhodococcus sp. HNM0569]NLU81892.1 PH domain-containing protein [Rhodococcus sp. HNM0569]